MAITSPILGRLGPLTTRLATSRSDVDAAQRLRFEVFHLEFGASLDDVSMRSERDQDPFDAACQHILVERDGRIVGTSRFRIAPANGPPQRFYAASEFAIDGFLSAHQGRTLMEIGRSCIAAEERSRRAMELMWHGIWRTALDHGVTTMFGCASLPGADIAAHALALHWLAQNVEGGTDLPPPLVPPAMPEMAERVASRRTFAALPALLKGYLRLGAAVAPVPALDPAFDTTDLFVALDVSRINPRYLAHYGENATRYAAAVSPAPAAC